MLELAGLFVAALVAATLIPAQSEAVLVVATAGNVLGSVVNWVMGRFLIRYSSDRRWFPFSQSQIDKATRWYARWGYWSLLGAWLPVMGDPLTLVASVLREPLWRFVLIVTLAKGGRYLVLAWITARLVT